MTTRLSAWAIFALSGTAFAQTQLRYEARIFNPSNNDGWTTNLVAMPGSRIEVRAIVGTTTVSGPVGLNEIIYQPVVSSWSPADDLLTNSDLGLSGPGYLPSGIGLHGSSTTTPPAYVPDQPGVYGRITPFAAVFTSTSSYIRGHTHTVGGVSYLRIAQNHITNWIGVGATSGTASANNFNGGGGVNSAQGRLDRYLTDPRYPPSVIGTTNILLFKFGFVLSPQTDPRTMTISTPAEGIGGAYTNGVFQRFARWYEAPDIIVGHIRESVTVFDAVITVPTPALLAPATTILAIARRRRR